MWKSFIIFIIFLSIHSALFSQVVYSGFIDKYPIKLAIDIDRSYHVYAYDKYNNPITLSGKIEGNTLLLTEKNEFNNEKAVFHIDNFDITADELSGTWEEIGTHKKLHLKLFKEYDIEYGEDIEWQDRDFIQIESLPDKYFKLVVSKDSFYPTVTGLKIVDKKSNKILQEFELDCMFTGLNSIDIDDYNFDGYSDFSVFEAYYSGPNTTRIYFLYNPETNKFFQSSICGTSLWFDSDQKRVYEHNQCCAGTSHMNAEYKIENNVMVLVNKTCLQYQEEEDDLIEVPCD